MQTEHWLPFAALTAFWLAIPGRPAFLVASYAQGKGRLSALFSVPGFVLAHVAAALAASHLMLGASLLSPAATTALIAIGGLFLFFAILAVATAPEVVGPFADNDNFRTKRLPHIFFDVFAQTFFERRTLFFYLAIAPYFLAPGSVWQPQVAWLIVATVVPATLVALYPALAADHYLTRMRRRTSLRRKAVRGGMVSLASGAVTAGYRKIAA